MRVAARTLLTRGPEPLRRRIATYRSSRYPFARTYLAGLRGVEIGGSAHNRYPARVTNVDRDRTKDPKYQAEERRLAGSVLPVDVVASGDDLPFSDKSFDFVLASHVIEHFPDPIRALLEWDRVATRYLFVVVPHRDRTFDYDRQLDPVAHLVDRHARGFTSDEDRHWTVWTCESFTDLCTEIGLRVIATEDPDQKVGNGFAAVIAVDPVRRVS